MRFGRQAIVLVPEISLTPQTEARFRSRFGDVAVLHSHLDRRRAAPALGADRRRRACRSSSAPAAPSSPPRRNLGLIVLDEEHENVVQAGDGPALPRPRRGARAGAGRRQFRWCSARPRRRWKAGIGPQPGEYRLVSLPRRVFDRPLPPVGTIDLRVESRDRRSRGAISRQLHLAMDAALQGRRAGDPAAESPRLFDAHPVPGLRPS